MKTFPSEQAVIGEISSRLDTAGLQARVSVHSDDQSPDSVIRTVIFKAAIALEGSESIVNQMADIGYDTDRAITYTGSRVEPTDGGEIRFLLFRAVIDTYIQE